MTESFPKPEQDRNLEHLLVDLYTPDMTKSFAEAPIYAKIGLVQARPAVTGEHVVSVLEDGTQSTENTANEGDMIVTRETGEEYILSNEIFASRWAPIGNGVFKATGLSRIMPNFTGERIKVMASWGEPQYGEADHMLAAVYDPARPDWVSDDRYILGRLEYEGSFAPANLNAHGQPVQEAVA